MAPAAQWTGLSRAAELLHAGDLLVFNDTLRHQARLYGVKATGGSVGAWSSACSPVPKRSGCTCAPANVPSARQPVRC